MATWLLKTEPSEYSFADLVRDQRTRWGGVTSAPALKNMREIRKGDFLAIYHTGEEKRVVGLAQAASDPFPDPDADDPRHVAIDVRPGKPLASPVALATFRTDRVLANTDLVRNSRLSVLPLSDEQFARLLTLAGD